MDTSPSVAIWATLEINSSTSQPGNVERQRSVEHNKRNEHGERTKSHHERGAQGSTPSPAVPQQSNITVVLYITGSRSFDSPRHVYTATQYLVIIHLHCCHECSIKAFPDNKRFNATMHNAHISSKSSSSAVAFVLDLPLLFSVSIL